MFYIETNYLSVVTLSQAEIVEPPMHTHPPIDPDDPSGASGEDVREPPLPGTQGTPREEFPRKGDLVDPEPSGTNK
jgi:hypothetical protein